MNGIPSTGRRAALACVASWLAVLCGCGDDAASTSSEVAPSAISVSGTAATVQTASGGLVGSVDSVGGGTLTFLGIPYAQPPVGALRWKPPVAASAWASPRRDFGGRPLSAGNGHPVHPHAGVAAQRQ